MQRVDRISKGGNKNKTTKRDGNNETMTTTTNRIIAVQMWGGERLHTIVWQGCDDPTRDRIRDCVKATRIVAT